MKRTKRVFGAMGMALETALLGGLAAQIPVHATPNYGWEYVDGVPTYWYEGGVKQGTEGRGREIYDHNQHSWYWLDAIDGGRRAESKDVYQESLADDEGSIGKWVRYDDEGRMVKGWDVTEAGTYYFDYKYGTMAKGSKHIDGVDYFFNEVTGILEDCSVGMEPHWETRGTNQFWYEGGILQGCDNTVSAYDYRGKEIYDPGSDAWYWLDNGMGGAKAVSRDVYQKDSQADAAGRKGKWVRYDSEGHMVKGWDTNENGTYYFDPVYGTMAKGQVEIDGRTYWFDLGTGICAGEDTRPVKDKYSENGVLLEKYDDKGNLLAKYNESGDPLEEYDSEGNLLSRYEYEHGKGVHTATQYDGAGRKIKYASYASWTISEEYLEFASEYEYNEKGDCIKVTSYGEKGILTGWKEKEYDENDKCVKVTFYDVEGKLTSWEEWEYDENDVFFKALMYDAEGKLIGWKEKEYDENGECVMTTIYDENGEVTEQHPYDF